MADSKAAADADPSPEHDASAEIESIAGVTDTELEFCLPVADAGRLWRTRALAPLRSGRIRTVKTRITWHDAPDGRLAEAGRALLHIQEGGRSVWQMQPARRDGLRNWPLGMPAPLLDEVGDRAWPAVAALEGNRRSLIPELACGVSRITLLDGTLSLPGTSRPIARLSLRGEPVALFALARALLEDVPLSLPADSLSGEVHAFRHGAAPPAPPALHETLEVDDALSHLVGQLAAAIAFHAPGARVGERPEPVHQMRVALRRLRSALSLFGRVADGPKLDGTRQELAALARALGPARDWDVFLSGTVRQVAKLLPNEPAVRRLVAAAGRRRKAAYGSLTQQLDQPDFQRTLLHLVELAITRPWRRDGAAGASDERPALLAFARHALDRRLRRVIAVPGDLTLLSTGELHALRISCKRLRYAAEFFSPLMAGRQTRRFLRRLAAVQERLGHLNDGAVAGGLLGELGQRGYAAGIVQGYLAARAAGGRDKAERSWRRFRRIEPFWS